jgi:hypothetical protein
LRAPRLIHFGVSEESPWFLATSETCGIGVPWLAQPSPKQLWKLVLFGVSWFAGPLPSITSGFLRRALGSFHLGVSEESSGFR